MGLWIWYVLSSGLQAGAAQRYRAHTHPMSQAPGDPAVVKGAPASSHVPACARCYKRGKRERVPASALGLPFSGMVS